MFDVQTGIGGINHYALPYWRGSGVPTPKYGDIASEQLHRQLVQKGASAIKARIFGGANQFGYNHTTAQIGAQNIQYAIDFCRANNIAILCTDTGGSRGRRLTFETNSGLFSIQMLRGGDKK